MTDTNPHGRFTPVSDFSAAWLSQVHVVDSKPRAVAEGLQPCVGPSSSKPAPRLSRQRSINSGSGTRCTRDRAKHRTNDYDHEGDDDYPHDQSDEDDRKEQRGQYDC